MADIDTMQIVNSIMDKYPDNEWYDRCIAEIPDIDKGWLISLIEIEMGGDARVIYEDGSEHPETSI